MLKKQMRLIITFDSTVEAMRMETACKEEQALGRLIPTPRAITAGCGLCYMTQPEAINQVEQVIQDYHISYQDKVAMLF